MTSVEHVQLDGKTVAVQHDRWGITTYSVAADLSIIVRVVLQHLDVSPIELFGAKRAPRFVLARELISAIARDQTRSSYPEIARAMCRPTHATVMAAERRLRARLVEEDPVVVFGDTLPAVYATISAKVAAEIERRRSAPVPQTVGEA